MGHADIKSAEHYLHFTREAMLRIVDAQSEDSETRVYISGPITGRAERIVDAQAEDSETAFRGVI